MWSKLHNEHHNLHSLSITVMVNKDGGTSGTLRGNEKVI
jgi:hypothetical protein